MSDLIDKAREFVWEHRHQESPETLVSTLADELQRDRATLAEWRAELGRHRALVADLQDLGTDWRDSENAAEVINGALARHGFGSV